MMRMGYGFDVALAMTRAREIAGDPRFCGSAWDAVRQAVKDRDVELSSCRALILLVCPPERLIKTILSEPPGYRAHFRKRMLMDFESAVAKLIDATKPSARRVAGVAAARDAQNWANDKRGLSREESFATWEETFKKAMEEYDRDGKARGIDQILGPVQ